MSLGNGRSVRLPRSRGSHEPLSREPSLALRLEPSTIPAMTDAVLHNRCQRCGTEMDMRDPGPGMAWTPDQFWVCPKCGRHFWSTYPPPKREEAAKPAAPPPPTPTPVTTG